MEREPFNFPNPLGTYGVSKQVTHIIIIITIITIILK